MRYFLSDGSESALRFPGPGHYLICNGRDWRVINIHNISYIEQDSVDLQNFTDGYAFQLPLNFTKEDVEIYSVVVEEYKRNKHAPFADEIWYFWTMVRTGHFGHVNPKDPMLMRWIKDHESMRKMRYVVGRPGLLLSKYNRTELNETQIKDYVESYKTVYQEKLLDLRWATTPDEIEHVYSMHASFNSCMQKSKRSFTGNFHPVRVYGAGDLAVAYLMKGDSLQARALVWKEKNRVGRVYGDATQLQVALRQHGIITESTNSTYDGMRTAKLLKVPRSNNDVRGRTTTRSGVGRLATPVIIYAPYLDGNDAYVLDRGDHLEITPYGPPHAAQAQNPDGTTQIHPTCYMCGGSVGSGGYYTVSAIEKQPDGGLPLDVCCDTCSRRHTTTVAGFAYRVDNRLPKGENVPAVVSDFSQHGWSRTVVNNIYNTLTLTLPDHGILCEARLVVIMNGETYDIMEAHRVGFTSTFDGKWYLNTDKAIGHRMTIEQLKEFMDVKTTQGLFPA